MPRVLIKSQTWNDTGIPFQLPGEEDTTPFAFPVYEDSSNMYALEFEIEVLDPDQIGVEEEVWIPAKILSLNYSGLNSYALTQTSQSSFEIRGIARNVFLDEFYRFLMPDLKTLKVLPKDTTEVFAAVVRWAPPGNKIRSVTHSFAMNLENKKRPNNIEPFAFSIDQDVHWRYQPSLAALQQFVAKGTI